jgi:hypothetical protein
MIEIKTKIDPIKYTLPVNTIKIKNGILDRLFGRPKYQELKFTGSPVFEPVTLTIKDELDAKEWIFSAYTIDKKNFDYKKELKVFDNNGNEYHLHGCFPLSVDGESVKISYDYFTVNNKTILPG